MAQPIGPFEPSLHSPDELLDEIERLRRNLQSSHLLELINGLLEQGPSAAGILLEHMNVASTRQGLENLARTLRLVGAIDPSLICALQAGIDVASKVNQERKPPSVFTLLRELASPETRRGLSIGIGLLRGIGSTARL